MLKIFKKSCAFVAAAILLINITCVFGAGATYERSSRYSGYGEYDGITPYATEISRETINYTSREYEYIETTNGVPMYMPTAGLENGCGAVGGSIVVGFYDKYYENLIPGYTPHLSSGKYKNGDITYVPQLIRDLYKLMRTNVDDVGVSESDCIEGLKQYVKGKGYSIQLNSIRSGSVVDETLFRSAINNNQPVLLFCDRTDIYTVSNTTNADVVGCYNLTSSGHIVVAYGLYIINYYNGNTLFRTDKYINVATGLSTVKNNYLKLQSTDWCNGAYSVDVY